MKRIYVVFGEPVAWKRPAQTVNGIRYDAQKHEKEGYAVQLLRYHRGAKIDAPMKLYITFYIEIPKSWSDKKKQAAAGTYVSIRPDTSNLIKFIEDACNGVIWRDDSLVVEIVAQKVYDFTPRTVLNIEELDNEERFKKAQICTEEVRL